MPTVEDYFDDDTDFPLPVASSSSSKPRSNLPDTGLRGALLEEITSEDEIDDMDFSRLAEQSRGVFGEDSKAPPPGSGGGKGKVAVREDDGELRPSAPQTQGMNPNTPMGGFMGDMMKLQQVEEERMAKLRKQMGATSIAPDPTVFKA
jgi:signal recognition particle subunit SRP19